MQQVTCAPCAVCGSADTFRISSQPEDFEYFIVPKRDLAVFHCRGCGSRFVHPRPSIEELISFYPSHYHAYNDDNGLLVGALVALRSRIRARRYLESFSARPIRLFDVGAGDCRHFDAIAKHGSFEFAGVEINEKSVLSARARGYEVIHGTLEDSDLGAHRGRYHIVTMYQLVEHVLDPSRLFAQSMSLLSAGGMVTGLLPCMDSVERCLFGRYWQGYHYPRHLQMMTRRGLAGLLAANGFVDIRVKSALHLQAGLSLQSVLIGRGYRPKMVFGKTPLYPLLLVSVAPFCILEHMCGQGGMMTFEARKSPTG